MKLNRSLSRLCCVPVLPASCSDFYFQAELLSWVCPNKSFNCYGHLFKQKGKRAIFPTISKNSYGDPDTKFERNWKSKQKLALTTWLPGTKHCCKVTLQTLFYLIAHIWLSHDGTSFPMVWKDLCLWLGNYGSVLFPCKFTRVLRRNSGNPLAHQQCIYDSSRQGEWLHAFH